CPTALGYTAKNVRLKRSRQRIPKMCRPGVRFARDGLDPEGPSGYEPAAFRSLPLAKPKLSGFTAVTAWRSEGKRCQVPERAWGDDVQEEAATGIRPGGRTGKGGQGGEGIDTETGGRGSERGAHPGWGRGANASGSGHDGDNRPGGRDARSHSGSAVTRS